MDMVRARAKDRELGLKVFKIPGVGHKCLAAHVPTLRKWILDATAATR